MAEKQPAPQDKPADKPPAAEPAIVAADRGMISSEAVKASAAAAGPAQAPPPAKLIPQTDTDGSRREDLGPPLPPVADAGGPVPRLVDQSERAPAGLKRFKVLSRTYRDQPTFYVLARDRAEAERHYLDVTRLAQAIEDTAARGLAPAPAALLTKELID